MRDFGQNPYSPDEARIAKYFADRGTGGGDDPVGFILASYSYLVKTRQMLRERCAMVPEMLFAEMQGHTPSDHYEDGYSDACAATAKTIRALNLD